MKRLGFAVAGLVLVSVPLVTAQTFGVRKRSPKPDEFGNVIMSNYAARIDSDPVVFPHWLHRAKFTCRLCHVDLGFSMIAQETDVKESDNQNGLYCGACHNGNEAFAAEETTAQGEVVQNCKRCHSGGPGEAELEYDFYEFVKDFPRARFGNRVDWMKAEDQGLIALEDQIEGISFPRTDFQHPEEFDIKAAIYGIPDIIFSHDKHVVWNGCELCHPQIFGVKRGGTVYDMQDIFDGKFCGACHGSVAFPNEDCQLCHTKEVF